MARPVKLRRICTYPDAYSDNGEEVVLALDELEVVRLIDVEGLSQEQCALQMNIARPTVAVICGRARYKLALAAVKGRNIVIGGGNISLCSLFNENCCGKCGEGKCGECIRNCPKRDILDYKF